jgi:hypothetical protein
MYGVSARLVSKAAVEAEAKGLEISIEGRRGKISQKSPPSSSQGKTTLEVGGANPAVALSTEVSLLLGRWQEVGRV